jgi:hypothetical protein
MAINLRMRRIAGRESLEVRSRDTAHRLAPTRGPEREETRQTDKGGSNVGGIGPALAKGPSGLGFLAPPGTIQ